MERLFPGTKGFINLGKDSRGGFQVPIWMYLQEERYPSALGGWSRDAGIRSQLSSVGAVAFLSSPVQAPEWRVAWLLRTTQSNHFLGKSIGICSLVISGMYNYNTFWFLFSFQPGFQWKERRLMKSLWQAVHCLIHFHFPSAGWLQPNLLENSGDQSNST